MPSFIFNQRPFSCQKKKTDSKKITAVAYFTENHSTVLLTMKVVAMGQAMSALYVNAREKKQNWKMTE